MARTTWEPGLVSVTFRQLAADDIVRLSARCQLRGIEWGGDVHCPPDDFQKVRHAADATRAAGLTCAAYGSYYRAGERGQIAFERIVEAAEILEAPLIRVWAGARGSRDADGDHRARVIEDLHSAVSHAAAAEKNVSLEFHADTLTDTVDSALSLLHAVPELSIHWQPSPEHNQHEAANTLRRLLPRLSNIHVFAWERIGATFVRRALEEHRERWEHYLTLANAAPPRRRFALLEFVRDDDPAQLERDARTLRNLIAAINARATE